MESDEEEIGMPERPEAGPPGAQSSAPTVDPVSPQIPENFATDLLLPQIPDPGAIYLIDEILIVAVMECISNSPPTGLKL